MSEAETGDPVSWLLIQPGWKVVAADGTEVGRVDEVAGDDTRDIFDGLAVATSALGKPRYVPSEIVGSITDGVVRLTVSTAEAAGLSEYLEPATSAELEPDDHRGLGETTRTRKTESIAKRIARAVVARRGSSRVPRQATNVTAPARIVVHSRIDPCSDAHSEIAL